MNQQVTSPLEGKVTKFFQKSGLVWLHFTEDRRLSEREWWPCRAFTLLYCCCGSGFPPTAGFSPGFYLAEVVCHPDADRRITSCVLLVYDILNKWHILNLWRLLCKIPPLRFFFPFNVVKALFLVSSEVVRLSYKSLHWILVSCLTKPLKSEI